MKKNKSICKLSTKVNCRAAKNKSNSNYMEKVLIKQ